LRCLKDNDRSLLNIPRSRGGSRSTTVRAATSVALLPVEAFRARDDGRLAASACGRVTNKNYATKSKTPFYRDRYVLRKRGGTIEARRNNRSKEKYPRPYIGSVIFSYINGNHILFAEGPELKSVLPDLLE
jgi:hypothetical protein